MGRGDRESGRGEVDRHVELARHHPIDEDAVAEDGRGGAELERRGRARAARAHAARRARRYSIA